MTTTRNTTPWTQSQRTGIYDRSGSLVVSAAAGTGKTAVLTERCVDLVAGTSPIEIDRLLVVTFTEAAALEMRDRIRKKLRDLYEDKGGSRLLRQLTLLDAASISTLHSFCLQVIRENFSAAGIEPDAAVLGDDEAQMLKDDVLGELFEQLYTGQDAHSQSFARFVANYGQGKDDGIRRQVKHLHEYLRSLPPARRAEWQARALAAYTLETGGTLTGQQFSDLRTAMLDEIDLLLEMGEVHLAALHARIGEHKGLDSGQAVQIYVTQLRADLEAIKTPAGLRTWIESAGNLPWTKVGRWGDVPENCRDWAKWLHDHWKERFCSRWLASAEAWSHGIRITADYAALLLWLVNQFEELFGQAKRRIGKIDYSDMEEHAVTLLANERGEPSDIARAYQQRYDVVLVDEFQDTNPIQAAIVHLVSRESADPPTPNLFVVGDVKQSIYGFRMTDPELFRQRQECIGQGRLAGRCISLQENFRSRPEVLGFINRVFGKLMQENETDVAYDDQAMLKPGRSDFAPLDGPAVELHLLDGAKAGAGNDAQPAGEDPGQDDVEALAAREKEAYLIARRIQQLKESAGLSYSNMVILLRSTQTSAPVYADTLRRYGIPVYAELRSGYFASREIKDMLCLLQVLENMRQDIPLAAVLRSPLFGPPLCDADLADMRLARPDLEFHQAVRAYTQGGANATLRHTVARQLDRLDRWRNEARLKPLAEVIASIYQETGLLEYVTLLRDGPQCRANLSSLYERARQFGQFSRQGLRRFVSFVMEMIRSGQEATTPTAVSQAQDVVRIMSIHASKGLEFPVVFLADLARQFNDMDFKSAIVLDRAGTLGIEARAPQRMVRSDTLIKLLAAGRVRRQSRAEELRVLYVAMTRAKERLILVGTPRRKASEWLEECRQFWRDWAGPLPRYLVRYANCPLDWVVPALAAKEHADEPHLFDWREAKEPTGTTGQSAAALLVYPRQVTDTWQIAEPAARLSSAQVLAALDDKAGKSPQQAQQTIARLTGTYPCDKLTRVPAITPVTELKGRLQWDDDGDEGPRHASPAHVKPSSGNFGVPRRLRPVGAADAARQKGTATHLFLERVDLAGPTDRKSLQGQLARLVERRLLSAVEAEQIDLRSVDWFLNETDLGRQLRTNHKTVRREMSFLMRLEPQLLAPGSGSDDLADCGIVRGVIDVLWVTADGIEIADFKTDAVEGAELRWRIDLYRGQLRMYAEAIRRIWKRPVCRLWLAFLHPRHIEPFAPAPLKG